MYCSLLVNHEKVVKFLNFIYSSKIKLWEKFSGICQVNPFVLACGHDVSESYNAMQALWQCWSIDKKINRITEKKKWVFWGKIW